jgi:ferritin-like metal-binding protein YciE
MAHPDDRVVKYLQEARADELALARTLRSHIAAAPRGPYRKGLEVYLSETSDHARRLGRRLDELGAGEGRFRSRARSMRQASGGLAALGRAPLEIIRRSRPDSRALRGAQFGCATEGLVIATYTALEHVAEGSGDAETAALAARIRAEEERMLEWLRHEVLKLTDPFIRGLLDASGGLDATSALGPAAPSVSEAQVKEALSRAERNRAHRV